MQKHLKVAETLAQLLDNQFHVGPLRFGLSALIDLIPGIGDLLDAALSLYIVWLAWQMAVPTSIMLQMLGNIALNFVVGAVPVFGDLIYVFRKVNLRNLHLLQRYVASLA